MINKKTPFYFLIASFALISFIVSPIITIAEEKNMEPAKL